MDRFARMLMIFGLGEIAIGLFAMLISVPTKGSDRGESIVLSGVIVSGTGLLIIWNQRWRIWKHNRLKG